MKNGNAGLKAGLCFGIVMGLFFALLTVVPLGVSQGMNGFLFGMVRGLAEGLLAGVIFGVAISLLTKSQTKKFEPIRRQMAEQHQIVCEGGANHFLNKEGVGGWLFLTPEFLFFQSHNLNMQNHELSIPISSVQSAVPCKLLKFARTGLKIEKSDGTFDTFTVNNPDEWAVKIQETRQRSTR